jgi:agmatine/peptidylarginine deiminase
MEKNAPMQTAEIASITIIIPASITEPEIGIPNIPITYANNNIHCITAKIPNPIVYP